MIEVIVAAVVASVVTQWRCHRRASRGLLGCRLVIAVDDQSLCNIPVELLPPMAKIAGGSAVLIGGAFPLPGESGLEVRVEMERLWAP